MDPDACLAEIRSLVKKMNDEHDDTLAVAYAADISEHIEALDEWLSSGGFAPAAWKEARW